MLQQRSHHLLLLLLSSCCRLDPSLAPEGRHIVHAFTPDWMDAWQGLAPEEYERKKEEVADAIVARLEALWPGLKAATEFREVSMRGGGGGCLRTLIGQGES